MKRKTIDTLREIRLWTGQLIIPAAAIVLAVPELRYDLSEGYRKAKNKIKNIKFKSKNDNTIKFEKK